MENEFDDDDGYPGPPLSGSNGSQPGANAARSNECLKRRLFSCCEECLKKSAKVSVVHYFINNVRGGFGAAFGLEGKTKLSV